MYKGAEAAREKIINNVIMAGAYVGNNATTDQLMWMFPEIAEEMYFSGFQVVH
jgi:hypothetical protein